MKKTSKKYNILNTLIFTGTILNQKMNIFDYYLEPPSWCVTTICFGLGIIGILYLLSNVSEGLEGLPPEACLGCLTGIVLGALFAYFVPLSTLFFFL